MFNYHTHHLKTNTGGFLSILFFWWGFRYSIVHLCFVIATIHLKKRRWQVFQSWGKKKLSIGAAMFRTQMAFNIFKSTWTDSLRSTNNRLTTESDEGSGWSSWITIQIQLFWDSRYYIYMTVLLRYQREANALTGWGTAMHGTSRELVILHRVFCHSPKTTARPSTILASGT